MQWDLSRSITMACLYCLRCTKEPESWQIRSLMNSPRLEHCSDSRETALQFSPTVAFSRGNDPEEEGEIAEKSGIWYNSWNSALAPHGHKLGTPKYQVAVTHSRGSVSLPQYTRGITLSQFSALCWEELNYIHDSGQHACWMWISEINLAYHQWIMRPGKTAKIRPDYTKPNATS